VMTTSRPRSRATLPFSTASTFAPVPSAYTDGLRPKFRSGTLGIAAGHR
jgi:hypothetical protein